MDRRMILVDSSVWIDYFNGRITRQTDLLDEILDKEPVIATFCVHYGISLLQDDRDFDPMVKHLGLETV
jgi:predicted nucleic acid-binding protein